jgi:hypothetical protein
VRVYALLTGDEFPSIRGIYTTPEAAMAAWSPPAPKPRKPIEIHNVRRYDSTTGETHTLVLPPIESRFTYEWTRDQWGWNFDGQYEDSASIEEYEVQA